MKDIRNIAIIAHVDHGKTTLVDKMLIQSGTFRKNEDIAERIMDSFDLERERGITILSKNASVYYGGIKINIVDTPGHTDFGGEVERVLKMVDGVLLLVDASEGTMPQTRFVLKKALDIGLKTVVVINKTDRHDARISEVEDEILSLFIDLGANDEQLEFATVYASAKEGKASLYPGDTGVDLKPLFDTIIARIPKACASGDGPLRMLVSNISYDDYAGRLAVGRIERGTISGNQAVSIIRPAAMGKEAKISRIYTFEGLKRIEAASAPAGDIVLVSGIGDIAIGDTICDAMYPEPLEFVDIDRPTISMDFIVNNSPFAGREGTFVTSRHLRERLYKETQTNLSLAVEDTDSTETFKVSGRGELHLSILIETMRRQGYEFQVSKPEAILEYRDGRTYEPYEEVYIEVEEGYMGVVMEKLGLRKAELQEMSSTDSGYVKMLFRIPARFLIGYRSEFLTDTRGNGVINRMFAGYDLYKEGQVQRARGSLVAHESGEAVSYGLCNAQERGRLFISPGTKVYAGMVIGENSRAGDLVVNPCRKKQMTNIRASGSDEALRLVPPVDMSLEKAIEFISDDEFVEVTPGNIRIRKKILDNDLRSRMKNKMKKDFL